MFMAVVFFCVAAVGYQLVKIDPMPFTPSGAGGLFGNIAGAPVSSNSGSTDQAKTVEALAQTSPPSAAAPAPVAADRTLRDRLDEDWRRWTPLPPSRKAEVRVQPGPTPPSKKPILTTALLGRSDTARVRTSEIKRDAADNAPIKITTGLAGAAATTDDGLPPVVRITAAGTGSRSPVSAPMLSEISQGLVAGRPGATGSGFASQDRLTSDRFTEDVPLPGLRPDIPRQHDGAGQQGDGFQTAALSRDVASTQRSLQRPVASKSEPKRNRATSTEKRTAKKTRAASIADRKKRRAKAAKLAKRKARRTASRRKSKKPLFKVRRKCNAYGCRKVVYARRPRNKAEAKRVRMMRNKVIASQIRARRSYSRY